MTFALGVIWSMLRARKSARNSVCSTQINAQHSHGVFAEGHALPRLWLLAKHLSRHRHVGSILKLRNFGTSHSSNKFVSSVRSDLTTW